MNSTCKKTFLKLAFFAGLLGLISTSYANEQQSHPPEMTIIKEYSEQATINGDFEASRRQWLASLRGERGKVKQDDDGINLDDQVKSSTYSREFLNKMVKKIDKEVNSRE